MLVFGLVHDRGWEPPGWEPPEEDAESRRGWSWRLPWRPLAWFAAWCWLMALVPVVNDAFGGLAAYGILMLAVVLAAWRLDRFFARQYWHSLREHKE